MAKNKNIEQAADFATDNGINILMLIGVGVAGYYLYKAIKGISDAASDIGKEDPDAGNNQSTSMEANTKPDGATITPNQAQTIASGLLYAMNRFGTDTEKIYLLLTGKNAIDYALIFNAFGEERYTGVAKGPWPNPFRNLTYWLQKELSVNELATLKSKMNGVAL